MGIANSILYRLFYAYVNLRKKNYAKKFGSFGTLSGIGKNGYGDGCVVIETSCVWIGDNTWINHGGELLTFSKDARIEIGSNVHIQPRCRITSVSNVVIGDDVLIAPDVFITDLDHGMDPNVKGGYINNPLSFAKTEIQKGVWLGQRVCVLKGVTIGEHSIIGANSVVTKDIPSYSVAVGSPARVIKRWNPLINNWEKL